MRNKVIKIKDENGDWVENPSRVRMLVDEHFINTFRSGGSQNWGTILDSLTSIVTEEMNATFTTPVLEEKIKDAALQIEGGEGSKLQVRTDFRRVEWDFLDAVMEKMRFSVMWRKLIMGYVTSVNFVVILNRQPGNKFAPSRGLRQGDPLSSYLFLLVVEVLSRMIQRAIENRLLEEVKMSASGPVIFHIFFANDTLTFLKADKKNCRNLVKLLKEYCAASGQKVNVQKSSVFFRANVPSNMSTELGKIMGMPVVENPDTYLGGTWVRLKK
nr:uncharacterized protein LOC114820401 [Malus domestica]